MNRIWIDEQQIAGIEGHFLPVHDKRAAAMRRVNEFQAGVPMCLGFLIRRIVNDYQSGVLLRIDVLFAIIRANQCVVWHWRGCDGHESLHFIVNGYRACNM